MTPGGTARRIARLEDQDGRRPCPRCSGFVVVRVNGEVESASRDGRTVDAEEWERLEAGMVGGRCPGCGRRPFEVRPRGHFSGIEGEGGA